MGPARTRWVVAAGIAMLMVATGCGAGPSASSEASPPGSTDRSAPASPTVPAIVPAGEFCAADLPTGAEQKSLPAPDGVTLNSVWVGSGPTTAVLLHQTDGNGVCGFLFYAAYLAKQKIRVVLLDLCNYGQSYCGRAPLANDPAAQVKTAADAARADGARRVVLVGASMGGSVTLTAAKAAEADAIVDLSGPAVFTVSDVGTDAANVTMPALFAYSHTDQSDLTAMRKALPKMPAKDKTFLTFDIGHGYELIRDLNTAELTPLARQVARFVADGKAP